MPSYKYHCVRGGAAGLVVAGTASSLLSKNMYNLIAPDARGRKRPFHKPWASTFMMFLGMVLCLPLAPLIRWAQRKARVGRRSADGSQRPGPEQPLLHRSKGTEDELNAAKAAALHAASAGGEEAAQVRHYAILLIPTLFDLVATLSASVGLLWVSASVYQMMRGSEIVFSAAYAMAFLGRRLNRHHLYGIAGSTVGIVIVGWANSLNEGESGGGGGGLAEAAPDGGKALLGMLLIVAAEAVQSAQVVAEDYFMRDLKFEPLAVVGYEGLFGTLLMAAVMLPLAAVLPGEEGGGLREDSRDTLHMLAHSAPLAATSATFVLACAVYNLAGMMVTDDLGAVTRTVLETSRTLFVWLADLALFYAMPLGRRARLGEAWGPYSGLQAVGFVVLCLGTLWYGYGDEVQSKELHAVAHARARARWARLRDTSMPDLARAAAAWPTKGELRPMRSLRIAGPARIRTAYLQQLFLERLAELGSGAGGSSSTAAAAAAAAAASARQPRSPPVAGPPPLH